MKREFLLYGLLMLVLGNICISIFNTFNTSNIVYVRSQELIYGYLGMKEAQQEYEAKTKIWQANIDSLQMDYQRAISQLNEQSESLSDDDIQQAKNYLQSLQLNLKQYTDAINKKAKEEDEKMTQGILNQINSFVEEYGKQHRYDIILGTTVSGNLLYGSETLDITDELLVELNNTYKGN